jgi:hypothetical protein
MISKLTHKQGEEITYEPKGQAKFDLKIISSTVLLVLSKLK